MLELYARDFTVVEIDSSYYRVPTLETVARWAKRTQPGFRFTAKVPGTGTHVDAATLGAVHPDVRAFRASLEPLIAAGKFVCALVQFPTSLRPTPGAIEHLRAKRTLLDDIVLLCKR